MGQWVMGKSSTAEVGLSGYYMSMDGLEGYSEHLLCEFVL